MVAVGVRQLKNQLTRYLRLAEKWVAPWTAAGQED